MTYEQMWITIGLLGQFMFTGRFVVQWLSSERNKRVTIPVSFWFLSICGSLLLLVYAVHKRDLVFTIGQSSGLFIYLRNLHLIRNEARNLRESANAADREDRPMAEPARKAAA